MSEDEFPKISVMIPVYNAEKYLDECLDSVSKQTYKNLEILIVDDGSNDSTYAKCVSRGKEDPRIRVIRQENGGVSTARNTCIKEASGEYLAFIDADDKMEPDMLERLYKEMKRTGADLVGCGFYKNEMNSDKTEHFMAGGEFRFVTDFKNFLKKVYYNNYLVVPWAKLAKKEVYDGVVYPIGKNHEDAYVIRSIAYNCKTIAWIPDQLYFYRQTGGSLSHKKNEDMERDNFNWLAADVDYYKKQPENDLASAAEQTFCHYARTRKKIYSGNLKKEITPLYKRYLKDLIFSKNLSVLSRIKYAAGGWTFYL